MPSLRRTRAGDEWPRERCAAASLRRRGARRRSRRGSRGPSRPPSRRRDRARPGRECARVPLRRNPLPRRDARRAACERRLPNSPIYGASRVATRTASAGKIELRIVREHDHRRALGEHRRQVVVRPRPHDLGSVGDTLSRCIRRSRIDHEDVEVEAPREHRQLGGKRRRADQNQSFLRRKNVFELGVRVRRPDRTPRSKRASRSPAAMARASSRNAGLRAPRNELHDRTRTAVPPSSSSSLAEIDVEPPRPLRRLRSSGTPRRSRLRSIRRRCCRRCGRPRRPRSSFRAEPSRLRAARRASPVRSCVLRRATALRRRKRHATFGHPHAASELGQGRQLFERRRTTSRTATPLACRAPRRVASARPACGFTQAIARSAARSRASRAAAAGSRRRRARR